MKNKSFYFLTISLICTQQLPNKAVAQSWDAIANDLSFAAYSTHVKYPGQTKTPYELIDNMLRNQKFNNFSYWLNPKSLPSWLKTASLDNQRNTLGDKQGMAILAVMSLLHHNRGTLYTQTRWQAVQPKHHSVHHHGHWGIGYRQVLLNSAAILGGHVFHDQGCHRDQWSVGAEFRSQIVKTTANYYLPGGKQKANQNNAKMKYAGWDIVSSMQLPVVTWAKVQVQHYRWRHTYRKKLQGTLFNFKLTPFEFCHFEGGMKNHSTKKTSPYIRFFFNFNFAKHADFASLFQVKNSIQESSIEKMQFDRVVRENSLLTF